MQTDEITLWSNLKKLQIHLAENYEGFIGYPGLYKQMRLRNQYKFIMDNEVWIIVEKELN